MEIAAMNTSLMRDILPKRRMKSAGLEPVSGITDLKIPLKDMIRRSLVLSQE
jgi:hypothetical protein